ncbi:hypothetical protein [Prosthecobacter sp.]|jgi:hypothetical protein|uniref:hypothetical protein n=1 Tax=Prosthecobacter sp. TaxID=1965333 RepID=UPI0037833C66
MPMPDRTPTSGTLIFAWKARDHSLWHLVVALLLLMAGMAGFFFIFRIVQPVAQRTLVTPQHVISLDPRDPVALALIHRAQDRSFALLSDTDSVLPLDGPMFSFRPSFEGHQIGLRGLESSSGPTQPRMLAVRPDVLPPVPRRATEPVTAPPAATLRAVMSPSLAKRGPASVELEGILLTQPTRVQFRVAVGPAGQIVTALPLSSADDAGVMRQLHAAVSNLRFAPSEANNMEWGEISFRWEAVAAP